MKLNFLTPDTIKMKIWEAVRVGANQILFQGDSFLLGKKGKRRLDMLADGWRSPVPIMAQCDCRDIDYDVALKLKQIGVTKVSLGVESFSDEILQDFGKKGLTVDKIEEVLDILLSVGIEVFANIILTSPSCEVEHVKETLKKIKEWMGRGVEFGINLYVKLFPGSEYYFRVFCLKENIGYPTVKTVKIPLTDYLLIKADKLLPENPRLRQMIRKVEGGLRDVVLPSEKLSERIVELALEYLR